MAKQIGNWTVLLGNMSPVVFSALGTRMVSANTSRTLPHDYSIHKILGPGYSEFPWVFCETAVGKLPPKFTSFGYFVKTLAKIVLSKNKTKHTKNIHLLTLYISNVSNAFRYKTWNNLVTYKMTLSWTSYKILFSFLLNYFCINFHHLQSPKHLFSPAHVT